MSQSNYEDDLISRNQELRRLIEEAKATHIPIAEQLAKLKKEQQESFELQNKWYAETLKESEVKKEKIASFTKFTFPMIRKMFSDKS